MDRVASRAGAIVMREAARVYGYPAPDNGDSFDPQLCHRCQWVRPDAGETVCETCKAAT